MEKLNRMVEECLREHVGGEQFFDALDDKIRNDEDLLGHMLERVEQNEMFDFLIVSGTFGFLFQQFLQNEKRFDLWEKLIVVSGGLRNGNEIEPFWKIIPCNRKKFIFIDDSFFLGRTRDAIQLAIQNQGGQLEKTYVFYDGSKERKVG